VCELPLTVDARDVVVVDPEVLVVDRLPLRTEGPVFDLAERLPSRQSLRMKRQLDIRARSVELVSLAPFYERFRGRVEGLTDDEYLWEPAPGCLTVRPGELGSFTTGGPPEPGPVTTIAWRMCHIGDFLRHERNWRWLRREPEQLDRDIRHPATAVGGIRYVEESWSSWQRLISSLTPAEMWEPLGSIAGPYGDDERIGFVIHIMDELIHHAAEIGVMRDLYTAMARS
jgi:DinB superfamily